MAFEWEGTRVGASSTAHFEVPVCTMASGHRLMLSVHVVTGNRAGPVTLVACGSHGEELWSVRFDCGTHAKDCVIYRGIPVEGW